MSDSVARDLAKFLVGTEWKTLPGPVQDQTKMALADTIAGTLLGREAKSSRIARQLVLEMGGKPEATLWGEAGDKVPAAQAARANSVLAEAMAINESHTPSGAHICGVVVPTAVAVGEREGASGQEVLAAIALGYEAAGRIGKTIAPGYTNELGFDNAVVTIFAPTVSTAKLLGLSIDGMTHAIALAATTTGGVFGSRKTDAREYQGGNSALAGVNAALAAAQGYTALETVLEHAEGYCHAFGIDATSDGITEALGERWEIVNDSAPKFLPGSHGIHTVVEATLGALKGRDLMPENIARITVKGPRWKKSYDVYHPQDFNMGVHSIPYFVARAVIGGDVTWDDLSLASIQDRSTWAVQDKVEIVEDPAQPPYAYPGGATVTIDISDGRSLSHRVEHVLGSQEKDFSWELVEAKYRELMPRGGISPARVEEGLTMLRRLDTVDDIRDLVPYLVVD